MKNLKKGSKPHLGTLIWIKGETFEAESEAVDLWKPKWNENQTILAAPYIPQTVAGFLDGATAGSWSRGIVEQTQGMGCCWLLGDEWRGHEGGDCGKCLQKKARQPWKLGAGTESYIGGGAITVVSLSPPVSTGNWTIKMLTIKHLTHGRTE